MSVDYTVVIARGFLIYENPYEDDKFTDDFIDDWVICFDAYDNNGPFIVGYYLNRGWTPGIAYEMDENLSDKQTDNLLIEACRKANIPISEIKTYFGVRVS